MILFLYGPDTYRRTKIMREQYDAQRKKYPHVDVLHVDLGENPEDWEKVRDFCAQPSMFTEKKIVMVRESGALGKDFAKEEREWIRVLKDVAKDDAILFIISDARAPKKAFQFLCEVSVRCERLEELEGKELQVFLSQEARTHAISFTPEALRFIVRAAASKEDRSFCIVGWCAQIVCAGFQSPVGISDVMQFVHDDAREEVFTCAKEINYARDFSARLIALEKTLLHGVDAAHLFNSLAIVVRGEDILRLADYDISIKSGGLEYEEALVGFAIGK